MHNGIYTSRIKHQIYDIPIVSAPDESGLWEKYRAHNPYQCNDYIE